MRIFKYEIETILFWWPCWEVCQEKENLCEKNFATKKSFEQSLRAFER